MTKEISNFKIEKINYSRMWGNILFDISFLEEGKKGGIRCFLKDGELLKYYKKKEVPEYLRKEILELLKAEKYTEEKIKEIINSVEENLTKKMPENVEFQKGFYKLKFGNGHEMLISRKSAVNELINVKNGAKKYISGFPNRYKVKIDNELKYIGLSENIFTETVLFKDIMENISEKYKLRIITSKTF